MFDPTAFENMKIVVEGAVYDQDFYGEITVTDRKDIMDLASLSRQFLMEMELKAASSKKPVKGVILLEADLKNLTAELLPDQPPFSAGSSVTILLKIPGSMEGIKGSELMRQLEEIWGSGRRIERTSITTRSNQDAETVSFAEYKITFGRLITEEQMDDLLDMLDYLIKTMKTADQFLKKAKH